MIDIGVPGSITNPAGQSVNSHGQVVGREFATNQPFLWDDGKLSYLETGLPYGNTPKAINDAGAVVGFAVTEQFDPHAARWIDGVFEDINPPWAIDSRAEKISDSGEIAGWGHNLQNRQRAILWREDGTAIDLGDFGGGIGQAYDVNNLSQVVGYASAAGKPSQGFYWEGGKMFVLLDLVKNNKAWQSMSAFSINDAGQLLAIGSPAAQPETRYLLLNPVPEPSTLTAVSLGCIAFATICRRGRRRK